ncbi:MAG: ECF transporter S component [Clostridiales bacterium]|jgi:uncharacterized membrane protein/CYTH domain-containing protein|nr:ECF transporter S component [Clostridiales bacterium]
MEIERKFILDALPFDLDGYARHEITQTYISAHTPTIRLRKCDNDYILTVKGSGAMAREEFELKLTAAQYDRLLLKSETDAVEKTRHLIPLQGGLLAELDVYHGKLRGLMTVEVEFRSIEEAERFAPPQWFGRDVTLLSAYKNCKLALNGLPAEMKGVERMKGYNVKDMVLTALFSAIIFISVKFFNFHLPMAINNGGLIHLGDAVMVAIIIGFGGRSGTLAGAFGMALFDLFSPYAIWTPFTFIIRFVMGLIIGRAAKGENPSVPLLGLAVLAAECAMVIGYYMAEAILYGNWLAPLTNISGNVVLGVSALAVGLPAGLGLKKRVRARK